jgi:hypothetical protein
MEDNGLLKIARDESPVGRREADDMTKRQKGNGGKRAGHEA